MLDYQFRPLTQWPRKPASWYRSSAFRAKYSETLDLLESELGHLKGKQVVLQAFVELADIRNDGHLRSGVMPKKPGIILSFESKNGPLSYPCDTYNRWQCNLRAIALALQALRTIDRYGVTSEGEQYRGWSALPPPATDAVVMRSAKDAKEFLYKIIGNRIYTLEVGAAIRECEMITHPDRGGNVDHFRRVQEARQILLSV